MWGNWPALQTQVKNYSGARAIFAVGPFIVQINVLISHLCKLRLFEGLHLWSLWMSWNPIILQHRHKPRNIKFNPTLLLFSSLTNTHWYFRLRFLELYTFNKAHKRACFCIGWSLQSIHLSFIGFTELVVSSKQPVTTGTRMAASQATSQSPCGRGFRDGLLWAEGVGGVQCPWPSISGLWSFPHSSPERHQMRHSWARTDPVHGML